ncbi:hypothetical protein AALP_AA2G201100 [Arabis alpina]|uniref:Thaumatin-like protein 1b n=1 Tax=Arabis alpina TaxID=50452 RepID=A0A087HIR0_ARAAL|nr:hypothetical protein AALP_AA2G201100 [Arabis alpina]
MASLSPLIFLLFFISGVRSTSFIMENKCEYTVWPGLLSNAGVAPLPTTGFVLQKGESRTINAPVSWGGRFWGRTLCSTDLTGKFTCLTGDCGSGKIECSGSGALPPATLAEFTLDGSGGLDFYDVSLVDGYNVPMLVVPQGGSGLNCSSTGCVVDLNGSCPSELRLTSGEKETTMGCKSACEAFRSSEYCCSGEHGTPDTCKPSEYSIVFKTACPRAYSYAYDDQSSTFTCAKSPNYVITFCPSPNTSQKSSQDQSPDPKVTTPPGTSNTPTGGSSTTWSPVDTSMIYEGALDQSKASPSTSRHLSLSGFTVTLLLVFCRMWRLF